MKNKKLKIFLYPLSFLIWIVVWHFAAAAVSKELLLPSPAQTLKALLALAGSASFWHSIANSLVKILSGFIIACVTGSVLASLSAAFEPVYMLFSPLFQIIKSTPVASFIILALLWIRSTYLSGFIAFLMVVPMIYFSVYQGIKTAPADLTEMSNLFRVPLLRKLRHIYAVSAAPYFLSAATTGIGFAWKSGIAAEIIGYQRSSIGFSLYNAKITLETPELFAWTSVIILLSIIMEFIFKRLVILFYGNRTGKNM